MLSLIIKEIFYLTFSSPPLSAHCLLRHIKILLFNL